MGRLVLTSDPGSMFPAGGKQRDLQDSVRRYKCRYDQARSLLFRGAIVSQGGGLVTLGPGALGIMQPGSITSLPHLSLSRLPG
ncbi:unnamed protein product [Arctogadus glacialis]